ncbi:MAG: transglutaminase-like domain-containing protein [candidate division Zixibacteria bacterium]|nr:transglutaminase-like domain-containing protein [candidate division Zixibacteria bacterium]
MSPKKYKILIKVALLDDIDYSIENRLTELFWGLSKGNQKNIKKIKLLLNRVKIGNKITFWNGKRNYIQKEIKAITSAVRFVRKKDYITYYFKNPPNLLGINFAEFEIKAKVTNASLLQLGKEKQKNLNKKEIKRLTSDTHFWPKSSSIVSSLQKKLNIDHLNDKEKVIWIHHWVRSNITGYKGPSKRLGVERTVIAGKGNCWECSDLFVTLCRKYNIPVRQLAGWLYRRGEFDAGHAWSEVFLKGYGWIPADAREGSLAIPCYYIPYYATDDGKSPVVYLSRPRVFVKQ